MKELTFFYDADHCQFFIRDAGQRISVEPDIYMKIKRTGVGLEGNSACIPLDTDAGAATIDVRILDSKPDLSDITRWYRIVQFPIRIASRGLVFENAFSESFGALPLPSGAYNIRVHWDANTCLITEGQHLRIDIWRDKEQSIEIIKTTDI